MLPIALTCGLMTLIRPTEVVCLLLPLLWGVGNWTSLREKAALLWRHRWQLLAFAGVLVLVGLPQFLYWKAATGHYAYTQYGGDAGEGMDWARPHLREVLVGFRKGWLVYTPLMGLACLGMAALYRRQHSIFWAVLVYLLTDLYLVSAWSCYWYAFCFGQRALIPTMAVMVLPLGAGLQWAWQKGIAARIAAVTAVSACILLNLFQSYQYDISLLDGDRMTWDYYKAIWGRLGVPHSEDRHLLVNRSLPDDRPIEFPELYTARPLRFQDFDTMPLPPQAPRMNGSSVTMLTPASPYTVALDIPFAEIIPPDQQHAFVRISGYLYAPQPGQDIRVVSNGYHAGKPYAYRAMGLPVKPGAWQYFSVARVTPELRAQEDIGRYYLLYEGSDTLYVEDLTFEVLARSPQPDSPLP
jgi:hypothetical protein